METTVIANAGLFAVLLALSTLGRRLFFRRLRVTATAAMGIVMAVGIFTTYSLPQLPFYSPQSVRLVTLELIVVWLFIAAGYVRAWWTGQFGTYTSHPIRRFGIGTWVAGTAVLAELIEKSLPGGHALALFLVAIACVVYAPYVVLYIHGYCRLLTRPRHQNATGVILLATVATQAVLIGFFVVVQYQIPDALATILFVIDAFVLSAGITLIAVHFHALKTWRLAEEWKNANCIVHGAISITGLAMLMSQAFGVNVLLLVWRIIVVLFVVIEALELVRLVERQRRYGLRQGLLAYDTTQWTRNFTFGMFYAFSWSLQEKVLEAGVNTDNIWSVVLQFVAEWGQFVVLTLLLIELAIFFGYRLRWPGKPETR